MEAHDYVFPITYDDVHGPNVEIGEPIIVLKDGKETKTRVLGWRRQSDGKVEIETDILYWLGNETFPVEQIRRQRTPRDVEIERLISRERELYLAVVRLRAFIAVRGHYNNANSEATDARLLIEETDNLIELIDGRAMCCSLCGRWGHINTPDLNNLAVMGWRLDDTHGWICSQH